MAFSAGSSGTTGMTNSGSIGGSPQEGLTPEQVAMKVLLSQLKRQEAEAASPIGGLQRVAQAKQVNQGKDTPLTAALNQTLQKKQEQSELNNLTTPGDQNSEAYKAYAAGNPQAATPFLQGQESALKQHKEAARKQYLATHGPGPLPSYLQDDPNTPSYVQENMLNYTAPSRTSWGDTGEMRRFSQPDASSAGQHVDNYSPQTP